MATLRRVLLSIICFCVTTVCLPGQDDSALSVEEASREIREMLATAENLRNAGGYDEGLDLALEALDLAHLLKNPELIAEAHYQTAVLHNFRGEFNQARAHLELGLSQVRMANLKSLEADLLVAEGIVEWKLGNLNLATHHLEEALEIRKNSDNQVSLANISNNLGIIQFSLKQYPEAIQHYERGIEWLGDIESNRLRASLYSNLAESLIPIGEYEKADNYLMLALAIEKQDNEPHSVAYTYLNLGELRSTQDRSEEAIALFNQALELQLSIDAVWPAALTRIELAKEFTKRGDSTSALEVLNPGFESVKDLNALSLLRDYAEIYSEIYTIRNETGMAIYYQELMEWFAQRVQEPITISQEKITRPSQKNLDFFNVKSKELTFAWIRIAIMILLAFLVIVLVIENMRLRKDKRQSKAID